MKKVNMKIWGGNCWNSVFPQTTTDLVIHPASGKTVTDLLKYEQITPEEILNMAKLHTDQELQNVSDNFDYRLSAMDIALSQKFSEAIAYVDNQLDNFSLYIVVTELPKRGLYNKIYLVPRTESEENNNYDEFLWVDNAWEFHGTKTVKLDLSIYQTKEEAKAQSDTKLDKVTSSGFLRAYCVNPDGSQNTISVASNANTWRTDRFATLVRSANGGESDRSNMESINVGYLLSPTPVQPFHTANKEYVDNNFAPNLIKDNPDSGLVQAVVLTAKQGPGPRKYAVYSISTSTAGISSGRLVQYFSNDSGVEGTALGNGRLLQHDPVQPLQVANKRYVDNSTKLHHISGYIYLSETVTFNIQFNIYSSCPNELLDPGLDVDDTIRILSQIFKPGTAFLRSMIDGSDIYTVMDMVQEVTDTTITTVTDHLTLELSTFHDFTDEVTEIEW